MQQASYQSTHQQMEQKIAVLEQQNVFFQQQVIALQNSKDELQKTTETMLRIELKQLQQTDSTDSEASNAECSGVNSGDFKALADLNLQQRSSPL